MFSAYDCAFMTVISELPYVSTQNVTEVYPKVHKSESFGIKMPSENFEVSILVGVRRTLPTCRKHADVTLFYTFLKAYDLTRSFEG